MQPPGPNYVKGAAFGFAAASIWAGQSPITRLGVTAQLDAWDVALLRFGIAGITLIPILLWRGLALHRIRWCGLALMIIGGYCQAYSPQTRDEWLGALVLFTGQIAIAGSAPPPATVK